MILSPGVWAEIETEQLVEQDGGHILGLDMGQNAAMSAASAYFPSGQLDAFACFPRVPSLQKRGLADGCGNAYLEMAKRNELIVMGERVSDIAELLRGPYQPRGYGLKDIDGRGSVKEGLLGFWNKFHSSRPRSCA